MVMTGGGSVFNRSSFSPTSFSKVSFAGAVIIPVPPSQFGGGGGGRTTFRRKHKKELKDFLDRVISFSVEELLAGTDDAAPVADALIRLEAVQNIEEAADFTQELLQLSRALETKLAKLSTDVAASRIEARQRREALIRQWEEDEEAVMLLLLL